MKKIVISFIIFLIFNSYSFALIKVDITRGNLDPLPIAVSPLHVDDKSENIKDLDVKNLGASISSIIEKNFKSTGLFNPLEKRGFCSKTRYSSFKTKV